MYAFSKGSTEFLKTLICPGAEVNYRNGSKMTPLMLAAKKARFGCFRELLAAGAEVNIKRKDDNTILMIAARRGYVDYLKELIAAGAALNEQETNGFKALMFSVYQRPCRLCEGTSESWG